MIIVKKRGEIIRFGLFLVVAGALLLYVATKADQWQKAEALGALPTVAATAKPEGLPGQIDLDGDSYFADHRITRDQLAAAQREEYLTVMNDEKTDPETRKYAQQRYLALAEQATKAKQAEQLIKARGYEDAAVSITEESVTVVVKAESVTQSQFVQLAEMVHRVTGIPADRVTLFSKEK